MRRSALVTALNADARVARWRLDPEALLTRADQPAVAARALLRRVYGGLLPPEQAASALACLGVVDVAGARYSPQAVRVAAALLVRLSLRPTEPIDPMS